jgi:hypothetical protein
LILNIIPLSITFLILDVPDLLEDFRVPGAIAIYGGAVVSRLKRSDFSVISPCAEGRAVKNSVSAEAAIVIANEVRVLGVGSVQFQFVLDSTLSVLLALTLPKVLATKGEGVVCKFELNLDEFIVNCKLLIGFCNKVCTEICF